MARLKRLAETTEPTNVPAGLCDLDVPYRIQALPASMANRTAGALLGWWKGRALVYWPLLGGALAEWRRRLKGAARDAPGPSRSAGASATARRPESGSLYGWLTKDIRAGDVIDGQSGASMKTANLVGAIALLAWPAWATSPVHSQTSIDAHVGQRHLFIVEHWFNVPVTLSAIVDTTGPGEEPGNEAVFGIAHSEWLSADSGTFEADLAPGNSTHANFETYWDYTFDATNDGFFNLTYSLDGFGVNDWIFAGPNLLYFIDNNSGGVSGTLSFALHSGHRYQMLLDSVISSGVEQHHSADFAWNISEEAQGTVLRGVPEPASWSLLIAGFCISGAALRRRQRPIVF